MCVWWGRSMRSMATRTRTLSQPKTRRKPAPVDTTKPHPDAWKVALKLAAGDVSRLQVCRDGAVVVKNP